LRLLYDYAWFVGFGVSFMTYKLMRSDTQSDKI
jgi:cytosine/uracil/thiamine/allantoin permease